MVSQKYPFLYLVFTKVKSIFSSSVASRLVVVTLNKIQIYAIKFGLIKKLNVNNTEI